jgi:transposase
MQDRKLYEQLLGIHRPWRVRDIDLQLEEGDVVVFVEHMPAERLTCPTCGETSPGYDTRRRRWRHLDTMQYRTVIEAEVPRVRCATHCCFLDCFTGDLPSYLTAADGRFPAFAHRWTAVGR